MQKDYMVRLSYMVSAPVAQLDRVLPSEGKGQRFESSQARHSCHSPLTRICAG